MKKIIVGAYDRYSYHVWDANSGKEYHAGGNARQDGVTILDPGTPGALSLRKLRSACIKTTREITEEQHAAYGGVERAEEE